MRALAVDHTLEAVVEPALSLDNAESRRERRASWAAQVGQPWCRVRVLDFRRVVLNSLSAGFRLWKPVASCHACIQKPERESCVGVCGNSNICRFE